jgi:glutathione synthase/RimK-type ligase-like ATP-grasp enzyme
VRHVDAVYDRHHDPERAVQRHWELTTIVGNSVSLSTLCDDKLAFARWARDHALPVPETVEAADPRWSTWPAAFNKPRRGARGHGVRLVDPGQPPRDGVVQRAVAPRHPGRAARVLLQRHPDRGWFVAGAMDRRAAPDVPVVSVATGADPCPLPASDLEASRPALSRLMQLLEQRPGAARSLEVGVDLVLSRDGPWIIEINARPGRSFDRIGRPDLRQRAMLHPFVTLLDLIVRGDQVVGAD